MLFSTLASYFEKLEATSSRLELIRILSGLFESVETPEEVERICYLVQGRIAPFFEPVEIGMAEKTVADAIARAFSVDREEVLVEFDRLGDMGLAVQKVAFHAKEKNHESRTTVEYVFQTLSEIAATVGNGTVDKKITLFADLLKRLDPISLKHLVRIPLSNLRLGIGDPTILDALAAVKLGDKKMRIYLENAYNRTSDLGLIARTLWMAKNSVSAVDAVEKLSVVVGKPIRSELCERLPDAKKVIEKMGEVDVQYKYDGFRVQIHKKGQQIWIYSRNLENMTHMFPELITAAKESIHAESVILDGEALAYNSESEEFLPFQETTKRRRKHGIEEIAAKLPLRAFIFDILYKNGKQLLDTPLLKRQQMLKETIPSSDTLLLAQNHIMKDADPLQKMLDDAITKGLEGVVIKKVSSLYEAGARNFNWVKLKRHQAGELKDTIDCVILGYIVGKGKRTAFGAGALLVGVYDKKEDVFVTVSKIGTGLTDEEWTSIKQRAKGLEREKKPARIVSLITPSVWLEPKLVIEVLADEITRSPIHTAGALLLDGKVSESGYALRFPRLVSFRDKDKKAEDSTSVEELKEMYKEQEKGQ